MKKIEFAQARELIDTNKDLMILDVRDEEEYITGHAINAVLFPVDTINSKTAEQIIPSKSTPILIYCRSGRRSAIAAEVLESLGYTELYDVGSLVGWPYGLSWD